MAILSNASFITCAIKDTEGPVASRVMAAAEVAAAVAVAAAVEYFCLAIPAVLREE
jgi:hypothetical protein